MASNEQEKSIFFTLYHVISHDQRERTPMQAMSSSLSSSPDDKIPIVSITRQHIDNCAISSWLPLFHHLTFSTRIIPLSDAFIAYLDADGVFLPDHANIQPQYTGIEEIPTDDDDDDDDDDEWNDAEYSNEPSPYFPQLEKDISDAIESLGGIVFPKLNWSSPRDACWISATADLQCRTPADIFLLLKSSDFIAHDLCHAYDECLDAAAPDDDDDDDDVASMHKLQQRRPHQFELTLRKWSNLQPSREFRCFVVNGELLAISQRDVASHYDHLVDMADSIKEILCIFFDTKLRPSSSTHHDYDGQCHDGCCTTNTSNVFPDTDVCIDVYLSNNDSVWLVDFNPFHAVTDGLMYTWDELYTMAAKKKISTPSSWRAGTTDPSQVLMRVIETPNFIQASQLLTSRLPKDAIDLATGEALDELPELLRKLHGNDRDIAE